MVVLCSTFFSSLAGGLMIVVFFSMTRSDVGALGRLSQATRKTSAAVIGINVFMIRSVAVLGHSLNRMQPSLGLVFRGFFQLGRAKEVPASASAPINPPNQPGFRS